MQFKKKTINEKQSKNHINVTTRNSLNTNGFTDGIFSVGILRSKLPTATFRP
jgi:hypothetical protein